MTTLPRSRRAAAVVLAISLAVVAPVMLTGCSLARNVVEGATGGKVDIGGNSVPKDFPKADVPLTDGDVVYGAGISTDGGKGWNVTIKVAGVEAFDTISAQLTAAGFTAGPTQGKDDKGATGQFAKGQYTVILLVSKSDAKTGWIANYTVTEVAASPSPTPTP